MRMNRRFGEETGAAAVIVVIMLIVFVGMLALTVDGGLLWTKHRAVRTANDAAALAAAYSCAKGDGVIAAETEATGVATENVADVTNVEPNEYPQDCLIDGGEVTVHYGGEQELMFGPAIGIDSPKPVVAYATATWGPAGGSGGIAPLMLSASRLSTCDIPFGQTLVVGESSCGFWFNNSNQGNQTTAEDLQTSEWGWIDITQWDVGRYGPCPGNASANLITNWFLNGLDEVLQLNTEAPPTYTCRGKGNMQSMFTPNGAVTLSLGDRFAFPVNDPSLQVDANGNFCPPNAPTNCIVEKYAIIGFGWLELEAAYSGNTPEAASYCPGHPSDPNAKCLVATWWGFTLGGVLGSGGGQNFGLSAVALTG